MTIFILGNIFCTCITEKVEEYYDVYKEEFNALLTLIQEKLQQQKLSVNAQRRSVSVDIDIVSDRLSIMVRLLFYILKDDLIQC